MQTTNLETGLGVAVLRNAMLSDIAQFRQLRLDALHESPTAFPGDDSTYIDRPTTFWESRLESNETQTIFFAEHEKELIGMTGIRRGESSKTKHSATIWGVYVRRQWRGVRIAGALIEACVQWATSYNVNTLNLGVTAASQAAVRC